MRERWGGEGGEGETDRGRGNDRDDSLYMESDDILLATHSSETHILQ